LRGSLEELNKKFKDVKLCVENLPLMGHAGQQILEIPYYAKDLVYLTKGLENVGITLDTGHANTIGSPVNFYDRVRDKVWNIHMHDNSGEKDDHLPLGEGNIDFKAFMKRLKETNYNGYLSVELDINWGDMKKPSQKERKDGIEFLKKL
jgi:sugar phosphate isomerase/epimerase